jgi:signal transduction histidine kinase
VSVALLLTEALNPLLDESPFALVYGAVAVSAAFAGVVGGVAASLLSLVLVSYFLMPPHRTLIVERPEDVAALVAFGVICGILILLAESMRQRGRAAETHIARVAEQAQELAAEQQEARALAEELETTNVELEAALDDANEARAAAVASEERMRLLDEASRLLGSSLDYETTMASAARLAVPEFADWAVVHIVIEGKIKQLALAHADPQKVKWARELSAKFPTHTDAPTGVPAVIRTGKPEFLPVVTDEMLAARVENAEQMAIIREVGVTSAIIVPMIARGQTLGALTFASSRPERHFGQADVGVARELASRAALAIDNARLYQAAVVANESKAAFLATMSHELRTPLTAIIGYQELLIDGISGTINPVQRKQLERIKVSAAQLLQLIDEILLYARVETGRESMRVESVSAKLVVDDAIAFIAPLAKERAIEMSAERIDPSLVLRTDLTKLRQMLVNILANAVKFTQKGRVTARAFGDGDGVIFEVEDTGIGIAPENLERVFDPFWQVEQNTKRIAGGSGLGLSVTRRLARLLGGDVIVRSQIGKGSTFRITLPKAPPD